MRIVALALSLALAPVAGCDFLFEEETPTEQDGGGVEPGGERDTEATYQTARDACSAFTVEELAEQLNTEADPVSVAEAFADGYQDWARQAAFNGCLDGLG